MTYVDLRPHHVRLVQVLVEGAWRDGDLLVYRRDGDQWQGWVRWSTGPGQNYLGWFGEESLRPHV